MSPALPAKITNKRQASHMYDARFMAREEDDLKLCFLFHKLLFVCGHIFGKKSTWQNYILPRIKLNEIRMSSNRFLRVS